MTHGRSCKHSLVLGFAALVLSACGAHEPSVTEQRRALSSEDEVSPLLGFSLGEALPRETEQADLAWDEPPAGVGFSPAASSARVTWSLSLPDRDSDLYRIEEVDVSCDSQHFSNVEEYCEDFLEATLVQHLETDDGALFEDVPVTFKAFAPDHVSWSQPSLDFSAFSGAFEMSADVGEPDTLRLGLFGNMTADGPSGELVGDLVLERDGQGSIDGGVADHDTGPSFEAVSGQVFYVARW